MGTYNPNLPVILGQEWVPIRDEDVTFAPNVNSFEHGTTFTLSTPRQANAGAYYVHNMPAQATTSQVTMLNVYPEGEEDQSGPIEEVLIPVTSGSTTGSGFTISGGSTIAEVLQNPGDLKRLIAEYVGSVTTLWLFFGVSQYNQLLAGKRILNVSFVYAGAAVSDTGVVFVNPTPTQPPTNLYRINNAGQTLAYYRYSRANTGSLYNLGTAIPAGQGQADSQFGEVNLGDANIWWDNTTSAPSTNPVLAYPWRYEELLRFEGSTSDRQFIRITFQVPNVDGTGSSNNQIRLDYAALKVTYCEEQRVAYGGKYGSPQYGVNPIALKDLSYNTNPILTAGDYAYTMTMLNPGDLGFGLGSTSPSPDFNGLRELYTLDPQEGLQVEIPYPLSDHIGETFTTEETVVLPQLSLHTSGGTVFPETHVYGRQVAAEVYGSRYAQQEVFDTPVGGATEFPWVRFVARRFGDTTVSLTLTGQGGLAASTVSITPGDFDELPEILDGWKEVTLQFNTPPSMGALGTPNWRWTATGETAGNRWEILGASAPAISGTPGNLYNLAPSARQLYNATYYQPTGATQDLEWIPQGVGSSYISGAGVSDDSSDAFLIFSQMPEAVSGFDVDTLCQPVTGIGQECDLDPCCIPTALAFNALSWNPPTSGWDGAAFEAFEIQRMDTVETDWQTIMLSTDESQTDFNDFEARIGILTSYRIRLIGVYGFEGPWSSTITATIPAPGIEIGCQDGHVLTFTSNERQDGSLNLAYSSVWMEQQVEENFSFPEASFTQLQPMYDRNYFTAFRPTERGGEQFTRTVLVQAAAIDPETLGDFRSLRDMAWADVSYICVRDEDGNRWFATIGVPSGRVINNRRLYLAPVQIVEVTDTPSPVDLAATNVAGTVDADACEFS